MTSDTELAPPPPARTSPAPPEDATSEWEAGGSRHRPADTGWMALARCRQEPPERFFPTDGAGLKAAKQVCTRCPVREACLGYAVANHIDHGVWGGASERARRRIARSRRREATDR